MTKAKTAIKPVDPAATTEQATTEQATTEQATTEPEVVEDVGSSAPSVVAFRVCAGKSVFTSRGTRDAGAPISPSEVGDPASWNYLTDNGIVEKCHFDD